MTIRAGCILEAHHKYQDLEFPEQPWDRPEAIERFKEMRKLVDEACIAVLTISEAQAQKIVDRLWPNSSLLGATCGQGFSIKTADQASVVNEVLGPDIRIWVSDKHTWMLQTWPKALDSD